MRMTKKPSRCHLSCSGMNVLLALEFSGWQEEFFLSNFYENLGERTILAKKTPKYVSFVLAFSISTSVSLTIKSGNHSHLYSTSKFKNACLLGLQGSFVGKLQYFCSQTAFQLVNWFSEPLFICFKRVFTTRNWKKWSLLHKIILYLEEAFHISVSNSLN